MKKILMILLAACCVWAAWDATRPTEKYVVKATAGEGDTLWHLVGDTMQREGDRRDIREVGSFETVELISAGAARFIRSWEANGLGWVAEPISERGGYMTVIAYYGSSSYDTAEMSRLVEAVVEEAKGLGVETMTSLELDRLKAAWKGS